MEGTVYVFVLDSLRKDFSENLFDEFESSNKVVANFGWSLPSHNAMFTSKSADEVGTLSKGEEVGSSIGGDLREMGFSTCLVSRNVYFSEEHGYDDFSAFYRNTPGIYDREKLDDFRGSDTSFLMKSLRLLKQSVFKGDLGLLRDGASWLLDTRVEWFRPGDSGLKVALSKLERTDHDFYAVNLAETHWPYFPPFSYWIKESSIRRMTSQISFIREFGKQLPPSLEKQENIDLQREVYGLSAKYAAERLEEWVSQNTNSEDVVIVTSDHGELLGEEDSLTGHAYGFTPEIFHVPFYYKGDIELPNFFGLDQLYDYLISVFDGTEPDSADRVFFYHKNENEEIESKWDEAQKGVITEKARRVEFEESSSETFEPFSNAEGREEIDIEIPDLGYESSKDKELDEKIKQQLERIGYM